MHFLAILFCLKAQWYWVPSSCCLLCPLSTDVQDIIIQNVVLTQTAVRSSHLARVSEDSLCLMHHTVKVVYGMDSGIRKRLFHSSSSETCPLRCTWALHCLQTALPASVCPSLLLLFVVTRRLMVPTGSISCRRAKKHLLFWSFYWETIQHFDFNLRFSVTLWRKRYLWKVDCSCWFLHTKMSQQSAELLFKIRWSFVCRSQWPRVLKRGSAAARVLRWSVRIPPGA
jgi:hypothetical protein